MEPGILEQEGDVGSGLHIVVLKGEDAVNVVKEKTALQPIVEVLDRNNLPVAGAEVLFTSPHKGPSVTFLNGSRSMTIVTDAKGRAAPVGLKPLTVGKFQISVSASFRSQRATASIPMTNVMTTAATTGAGPRSGKSKVSPAMIGVLVGVGAAAAVGIGVGLGSHHGSSSSTAATPTATIGVVGGSSVGAPH
jgi:hypothetical protein